MTFLLKSHDLQCVLYLKVAVKQFDFCASMQYLISIAGGRKHKSSATAIVAEIKKNYCNVIENRKNYYEYLLHLLQFVCCCDKRFLTSTNCCYCYMPS